MPYVSDKRLYVNKDKSRVVEESDPEAAYLLVAEGSELSDADAEKYGLGGAEVKQVAAAPENKQVRSAPETKTSAGR